MQAVVELGPELGRGRALDHDREHRDLHLGRAAGARRRNGPETEAERRQPGGDPRSPRSRAPRPGGGAADETPFICVKRRALHRVVTTPRVSSPIGEWSAHSTYTIEDHGKGDRRPRVCDPSSRRGGTSVVEISRPRGGPGGVARVQGRPRGVPCLRPHRPPRNKNPTCTPGGRASATTPPPLPRSPRGPEGPGPSPEGPTGGRERDAKTLVARPGGRRRSGRWTRTPRTWSPVPVPGPAPAIEESPWRDANRPQGHRRGQFERPPESDVKSRQHRAPHAAPTSGLGRRAAAWSATATAWGALAVVASPSAGVHGHRHPRRGAGLPHPLLHRARGLSDALLDASRTAARVLGRPRRAEGLVQVRDVISRGDGRPRRS